MKHTKQRPTHAPIVGADFSDHRDALKDALMTHYDHQYREKPLTKPWFKSMFFKVGSSTTAAVAIAVLSFSVLTSPLTAQKVLAQAQSAATSAQEQGRYRYSKTVFRDSFMGQNSTFTTETWEDTETGDHKMVTTDDNGTVVDSIVVKGDTLYTSSGDNFIVQAFGDSEGTATEVIELSEEDVRELGFEVDEATGTASGFITIEGDDDLTEAEIQELINSGDAVVHNVTEEALNSNEAIIIDDALGSSEAVELVAFGSPHSGDIVRSSNTADRKALFNTLLSEDGATLIESAQWQDKTAVGIEHSQFDGHTSTMYFDADTYAYIGSEYTGGNFTMTEVVVEESYSNEAIDLSTEGLTAVELPQFEQ